MRDRHSGTRTAEGRARRELPRWETRAFEMPLYSVGRPVSRRGERGWMLDLTHHRIYLANPPAEVASFAVSHGYSPLALYRLMERGARRVGLGGAW